MILRGWLIGWLLLLGGAMLLSAQAVPRAREHGPSPEVMPYQNGDSTELYRLRIVNDQQGEISASTDAGKSWQTLGHVIRYTTKASTEGYTASKWAPFSAVCATAVNAVHVRTGYNAKADKGVVFSLLPKERLTDDPAKTNSFLAPDSSIYTDMPGGAGIFGGHWSPILGNPVALETPAGLAPLPMNYMPKKGDVFVIRVLERNDAPKAFVFENRFGGFITVVDWNDQETVIGQVLRPVEGIGRFEGSEFADTGRLRANHNGVICVSTSAYHRVAGFQIIPREHAMSPEMTNARTRTQWMVVGPLDARDRSWEGVAPLFRDYLRPSWGPDDLSGPDWLRKVTDRTSVEVRLNGGPWQPMPEFALDPDMSKPFPDWANTALVNVTHIRINLPVPARLSRQ